MHAIDIGWALSSTFKTKSSTILTHVTYQDGEVSPQQVGDENAGDDDGVAHIGAHGQEVVILRPLAQTDHVHGPVVPAPTAQGQAHQDEDLREGRSHTGWLTRRKKKS